MKIEFYEEGIVAILHLKYEEYYESLPDPSDLDVITEYLVALSEEFMEQICQQINIKNDFKVFSLGFGEEKKVIIIFVKKGYEEEAEDFIKSMMKRSGLSIEQENEIISEVIEEVLNKIFGYQNFEHEEEQEPGDEQEETSECEANECMIIFNNIDSCVNFAKLYSAYDNEGVLVKFNNKFYLSLSSDFMEKESLTVCELVEEIIYDRLSIYRILEHGENFIENCAIYRLSLI